MDQKFFRIPFASNGDKQAVPDDKTTDGYVSFTEGWGADYEKDMLSDAHAKAVERGAMNSMLNAITVALRQYQTDAFPEWITPANNGGTAYSYTAGVVVRHRQEGGGFVSYVSLVDNNVAEPGKDATKWQGFIYRRATQEEADAGEDEQLIITPPTLQQSIRNAITDVTTDLAPFLLPVGVVVAWGGSVPPAGWIEANGQGFDTAKNPKLHVVYPSGQVPDLRGRFIRGWAHGSGIDPDENREILSSQDDAMQAITGGTIASSRWRATDGIYGAFKLEGRRWDTQIKSGGHDDWGDYISFDSSRTARTAPETRPTNVALMYIVKTDQADNIKPEPTPTNIVVSPSSLTIGAGGTQGFTAQVLPVDLAASFPVTWVSTDTAVGTIDDKGLFLAVGAGSTDIIASVSSGLSVRVTVRVDVLLTSISLLAIPDQIVGDSYSLKVSKTPTTATERILYESTDNAVASVTTDGQLIAVGEGAATISVTGDISGVSASRVVKVTAVAVVPEFLAIENNLSEIADAGEEAQAESQKNLGLGELATKDTLTAKETGALPVADEALPAGTDLNDITVAGQYFQNVTSNATLALNYPEGVAGALVVYGTGVDEGGCRQVYMPYNSTVEYRRYGFGEPLVFSDWDNY